VNWDIVKVIEMVLHLAFLRADSFGSVLLSTGTMIFAGIRQSKHSLVLSGDLVAKLKDQFESTIRMNHQSTQTAKQGEELYIDNQKVALRRLKAKEWLR
jgi:hypothetical protein